MNYLIARIAPGFITPHVLALGRWFLAGLILAVLSRHELWRERDSILRAWREYVVLGSLGMLMCGAWVYWGAQTTSAMNIALIYAAAPVLIAVGAVFWLKESFSWRQTGGVLLALTGVMHVVVKGQWAALSEVTWVLGDGLIMVATACWAAYALLLKKWASPLSPRARLAATCLFGSAVLLPFAAWEWLLTAAPAWTWQASRCGRLLILRLRTKNLGCQSHCRQFVFRAFVRRRTRLGSAWRVFGVAPWGGGLFDLARHLLGFANSGQGLVRPPNKKPPAGGFCWA